MIRSSLFSKNVVSFVCRGNRLLAPRRSWYSTHVAPPEKKVTLPDVLKKYKDGTPLTMVTAYDYTSAYFVDKADVDVILVGDSLGMVMLGRDSTTEVTMDEMLHHCKAVAKGSKRALVVGDMPFGSFEISPTEAVRNACRLVKEGHVAAVKLEGGKVRKHAIKAIVEAGIPVIGHIGLTPQTAGFSGGFKVQGKSAQAAATIFEDALALQEAGCSAIVLEFIPELLGKAITKGISIPTFGIGAGKHTSGQVLVYHDMLGMYPNFTPKFCKQYSNIGAEITKSLTSYKHEVETHQFPSPSHSFSMKDSEWLAAHELILERVLPNKESEVAQGVVKALAQVKAGMEAEKASEKVAKVEKIEKIEKVEKVEKIEKAVVASGEKATGMAKENMKSTINEKPIIITQTLKVEEITPKPKLQEITSSSPLPSLPPPHTYTWDDFTDDTNFDVYYNSYFSNSGEKIEKATSGEKATRDYYDSYFTEKEERYDNKRKMKI